LIYPRDVQLREALCSQRDVRRASAPCTDRA
jgi:hypothetical protein